MKRVLVLALASLWSMPAVAHNLGCDGKAVPATIRSSCCGVADVHWLSPDDISQDEAGDWHVNLGWRQIVIANKKAEPSPDGCYWIFYPQGAQASGNEPMIYCFLIPMGI